MARLAGFFGALILCSAASGVGGCGDGETSGFGGSEAVTSSVTGGPNATTGAPSTGVTSSASTSVTTTGSTGTGTPVGACGTSMPRISDGVPAFGSGGDATQANDEAPATAWHADVPGWLAYDLSGVPIADRGRVVVAWYAIHAGAYLSAIPDPNTSRPIDYRIEVSQAPGGGSPPDDGWTALVSVTDNTRNGRQHDVDLGGANWLRLVVTKGTDPGVGVDLDVHRAPGGATDAWLLMGDSITFMSTMYAFSDLPARVAAIDPEKNPIVVDAGIGGTNTGSAHDTIDDALAQFPGCYVALAFGTNDHADSFGSQMESLIQIVLAAGKIPVVPRMPWSSGSPEGEAINDQIEAIYAQHPEVLRGPDLWATFEGRTDLIPVGDVHPNNEGMAVLREAWAETIAAVKP